MKIEHGLFVVLISLITAAVGFFPAHLYVICLTLLSLICLVGISVLMAIFLPVILLIILWMAIFQ
jgi:hypothetical protein